MKHLQWIFPPATREHILGDLDEGGGGVRGALTLLPYVLFSQSRRNSPRNLILTEVAVIAVTLALASKSLNPNALLCALVGGAFLILGDAYVATGRGSPLHAARQGTLAYASIAIFSFLFPRLGFPLKIVVGAAALGWILIFVVRTTYYALNAKKITRLLAANIRSEGEKFHTRIAARNRVEFAAFGLVVLGCAVRAALSHDPAVRITLGLIIAGALFSANELRSRASARAIPIGLDDTSYAFQFRKELERQCRALHSIVAWYLAPLLGPVLISVLALSARGRAWPAVLFVLAMGSFIYWLNRRAARRLAQWIEDLRQLHP